MPSDQATILLGSSRIKFDVDIATWKEETGEKAIQLSLPGTPPHLILRHLANDVNFKGKVIVDVMELQFFAIDRERERNQQEKRLNILTTKHPRKKQAL